MTWKPDVCLMPLVGVVFCGTLKNLHCLVAMSAKYGAKTADIKQMVEN